eukprot:NODE_2241_length_970_cov_249.644809.p1 GENE.NODE_2241_length_970_cov_249.644809~~NODE_2241_length_970_cov_249.644809.p1  ORF type:complete len:302 (+),score=94.38 NODE_2241_length_970_cov_249.644809:116-907(+)
MALFDFSTLAAAVYVMYITFAMYCTMNIITGIFVDRANRIMQLDLEHTKMEETLKRANWIALIRHVFADECGVPPPASCPVTAEMFRASTLDRRMQIFLERIGLHVDEHSALPVFGIIDEGKFGSVPLNELLLDLEMLSGAARQLDVYHVLRMVRQLREDMRFLMRDPQKREGQQPQQPQSPQRGDDGTGKWGNRSMTDMPAGPLATDVGSEDSQRMVASKNGPARPRFSNPTGIVAEVSPNESDLPGAVRAFMRGPSIDSVS